MRRARLSPFPAVMLLVVAPNTERAGGWICERCGTWLINDGNVNWQQTEPQTPEAKHNRRLSVAHVGRSAWREG